MSFFLKFDFGFEKIIMNYNFSKLIMLCNDVIIIEVRLFYEN